MVNDVAMRGDVEDKVVAIIESLEEFVDKVEVAVGVN